MTLQLPLTPQAEAKLREKANAAGKDVAAYVMEAVEEKLAYAEPSEAGHGPDLPTEEWIAEFRRWNAGHRAFLHEADDSRESIYAGRGE